MAQKKKNNTKPRALIGLQENWGWIAIVLFCLSAGFGFGKYYTTTIYNVKMSKIENENHLRIIEIREEKLEQMKRFQDEITDLKNELIDCKQK